MYESILERDPDLAELFRGRGHDPALFHGGDHGRVLRRHERHAALLASGHGHGLPDIGPCLMPRLGDARTMMSACEDLLRGGGKAPGRNGRRLEALDRPELWSLCRALAAAVRDGTYRPGRDRKVPVPKEGKPGQFRGLAIQDAEDRVVGRAAVRVLQPLLDPRFSPFNLGFRPRRGTQEALATALALAQDQGRWVWVTDDVAGAFDHIPFNRFLDACRQHVPSDVVEFIALIASTGGRRGLRQGSPASPLFMNLFYDHYLDWPWHERSPDLPLIRYADDLLVLCRTVEEARTPTDCWRTRATVIGTPLKGAADTSIFDWKAGASAEWLGYRVGVERGTPGVWVGERAWGKLAWIWPRPTSCRPRRSGRPGSSGAGWRTWGRASPTLTAARCWIACAGSPPGWRSTSCRATGRSWRVWGAAHARWTRVYDRELARLPHRLQDVRERVEARRSRRGPGRKSGPHAGGPDVAAESSGPATASAKRLTPGHRRQLCRAAGLQLCNSA